MKLRSCIALVCCLFAFTGAPAQEVDEKKTGFAVYPVVSYTPETNFLFGAVAFLVFEDKGGGASEYYRPSSVSPYAVYSLYNQLEINADLELYTRNDLNFNIQTRYMDYPDFYYGTGPETLKENEEQFTSRSFYIESEALKRLSQKVYVGMASDFRYDNLVDLDEEGNLVNDAVNGADGGVLFGLGPAFSYDSRDNVLYPSKGSLMKASALYYPQFLSNGYSFAALTLDLRNYSQFRLIGPNILALQFLARAAAGDDVPFYKLPKLGGSKRLRGISHANRYIGNLAAYAQAEVRKDFFGRFGGVAFAGAGNVARGLSYYQLDDVKVTVGVGGRFRAIKDEKLNVRIDLGVTLGREESGIYFLVKEAF